MLASDCGYFCSVWGNFMWDLWWTKSHWSRYFSKSFIPPLLIIYCCIMCVIAVTEQHVCILSVRCCLSDLALSWSWNKGGFYFSWLLPHKMLNLECLLWRYVTIQVNFRILNSRLHLFFQNWIPLAALNGFVFGSVQLCEGYFAYTVKCLFYLKPAVVTGTYTSICRVISETKCHFPFQFILFWRREITYYVHVFYIP
jgi:hypothetical protein